MRTGLFTAHEQHAPTTLLDHATAAEDAGFDEIEFLSSSPDQTAFIEAMEPHL
jgi:sugar phosphate isomerase/epimerase